MHVSGTLLLTQEGKEGSQRELQWVLERQGNQTLGLCVCVSACVSACVWIPQPIPAVLAGRREPELNHQNCFS